jgi:hypothetical protein
MFIEVLKYNIPQGPLAQLVEQEAFNLCVVGSNPTRPTIIGLSDQKNTVPPHCARSSAG